ncbi:MULTISPECIES: DUF6234 family protein [unclassified Streptomyces]|uniref:DUF6234 family protein n=1 Tax=unclassified Streptomyces TaxID=2593676 RepID=UPI003406FD5C
MTKGMLDVGLAVLLTGLEVVALLAVWFVGAMEKWAAKGAPVPDRMGRDMLALSVAAASSASIGYGCSLAVLPLACVSQLVMAVLLTLLLFLGVGTECNRRIGRERRRRRLRRERLRWHESQRDDSRQASVQGGRPRWPR